MFGDDAGMESALRWVNDWETQVEEQATRARALSQRIVGLSATAVSDDRLVEVTVGSSGALTGLWLDEAIRRRPASETAAQVLAMTQAALARLAEQATIAAEETVGRDSPAGRAVISSYTTRLATPAEG